MGIKLLATMLLALTAAVIPGQLKRRRHNQVGDRAELQRNHNNAAACTRDGSRPSARPNNNPLGTNLSPPEAAILGDVHYICTDSLCREFHDQRVGGAG